MCSLVHGPSGTLPLTFGQPEVWGRDPQNPKFGCPSGFVTQFSQRKVVQLKLQAERGLPTKGLSWMGYDGI